MNSILIAFIHGCMFSNLFRQENNVSDLLDVLLNDLCDVQLFSDLKNKYRSERLNVLSITLLKLVSNKDETKQKTSGDV